VQKTFVSDRPKTRAIWVCSAEPLRVRHTIFDHFGCGKLTIRTSSLVGSLHPPKVMKALAKLSFSQPYTYTWRTGKQELQAYLSEITGYPEREISGPIFSSTRPTSLPLHLQTGEPWIFKARVALAATLSGNYGMYNGFELLEHEPIPGREEYLHSEKYELKVRDWNRPRQYQGLHR
jgi:hypothetical protein